MGTRGYKIVRYKGRYWVYYNHYDSYPENFGVKIVSRIPVDPAEYKGENSSFAADVLAISSSGPLIFSQDNG